MMDVRYILTTKHKKRSPPPYGEKIVKRDAENPIFNTLSKTYSAICSACKRPTGTAYNHSCLVTIIQSHNCKNIPICLLPAKKKN